jgi:hypothetical protein
VRAGPSRVQRPAGRVPRSLTNTDYRLVVRAFVVYVLSLTKGTPCACGSTAETFRALLEASYL